MNGPLRWWVEEYVRLGREGFAAAHGVPVLLQLARPEPPVTEERDRRKFMTIRMGKTAHVRADPLELPVYAVRKAEGKNVFGMMITVGRAANNDIEIDADSISKFHAYLEVRDGSWFLRDANSSNGTFLGQRVLSAEGAEPLEDGAEVRFARVACRFLLPASFAAMLEKEAARLRPGGEPS